MSLQKRNTELQLIKNKLDKFLKRYDKTLIRECKDSLSRANDTINEVLGEIK